MKNKIEILMQNILNKADAALINSNENRFYFSEFKSSDGLILVLKDIAYLLIDFRYYDIAKKNVKNLEVVLVNDFLKGLSQLLKKHNVKTILLENKNLTVEKANSLDIIFNKSGVLPIKDKTLDEIIFNMRAIKTQDEIFKIQTAQQITEKGFNFILKKIKKGVSEKELALELEFYMRNQGADSVAFDLIVISGWKTSLPHGEPGSKQIDDGDFITLDIGATYKGYKSDMTRTVSLGFVSDKQKEVYGLVLKAQLEALKKVKPGVLCSEVDKKARSIIDKSSYRGKFGHALGHGVGLDIHEIPTLSALSSDLLLPSMVVTIEPGIYLNDEFGVRIEDMILVTDNGYKNFTNITKDLIIL